jgi:hypothetical protein
MYRTARTGSHVGAMAFAAVTGVLLFALLTLRGSDPAAPRTEPAPTARPSVAATPSAKVPKPEELDSAWVGQSPAATISVGAEATVTFRFRNTGKASWVRGTAAEASLAFTGDDKRFDPRMAVDWPLPGRPAIQSEPAVAPGDPVTFTFKVRGVAPGIYRIDVRPALVAVGWLRDEGVYTEVTVR